MKKKNLFNYIVMASLIAVMLTTTALSFAYWKSGIEGNNRDKVLNITIGEGETYLTTVDLADVANTAGKRLVPVGCVDDNTTQTDEITFDIDVTWNSVASSTSAFENTDGYLKASCVRIYIPGSPDIELLDAKGYGGYNLFKVNPDQASYSIKGGETQRVVISVSMIEPANREQYDLIAGQNIRISLEFSVQSPDDLNQQIS